MKQSKRRTFYKKDMVELVSTDLKEMNISPRIISLVLESYNECKKNILFDGNYVEEPGIGYVGVSIRRVSEKFSKKRYTIKIKESVDSTFQNDFMNKLDTDEEFQEIMSFNPTTDINE